MAGRVCEGGEWAVAEREVVVAVLDVYDVGKLVGGVGFG